MRGAIFPHLYLHLT